MCIRDSGNANRFFVDGGSNSGEGAVIVGHNVSLGQHRVLQVSGTTPDTSGMELFKYSANNSGPTISMSKSRGGAIGTAAAVNDNDVIGAINWFADDGTDVGNYVAIIQAEIDGTPGTDDTPGALVFQTTADGSNSPTERMRIDSSGNIGIGTTTNAIGGMLETYNATDNTKHWRIHRPGTAEFGIGVAGSYLHISDSSSMPSGSSKGIYMKFNTGEVGVGVPVPTTHFSVAKSANITQVALTSSSNAVAWDAKAAANAYHVTCLLYTSPSPRDATLSRMPSSA